MVSAIDIGGRAIGPDAPCFVIAEAGVNHNGYLDLAHALIDVAANAGADAVKFQTYSTPHLVTARAPKAQYQMIDVADRNKYVLDENLIAIVRDGRKAEYAA